MERPVLTIIIPHYRETFEFMRPLFHSLDIQRMMRFEAIEVLIVNDCGDPLDPKRFEELEHIRPRFLSTPENGGVGVARQVGLDSASGRFATFIDADDMMYSSVGLFEILSAIHRKPHTELFWFDFMEEQIVEEQYTLRPHNQDLTFCHGKVYNVDWLRKNDIRCHPTLRYNEDSYFNGLVAAMAKRIEIESRPFLLWVSNPRSTVRLGGLYRYRELPSFVRSISDLCAELQRRSKPFAPSYWHGLFYTYLTMQDRAWDNSRVRQYRDEVMQAAADLTRRFPAKLTEAGETELMMLYDSTRKGFAGGVMERQTWDQFFEELTTNYPPVI